MSNAIAISLPSGERLDFFIYSVQEPNLPEEAGLYMFCTHTWNGQTSQNSYIPVYIGQSDNLKDRPGQHEQRGPAIGKGAQFLLLAPVALQQQRDDWEVKLIAHFQPELNVHHKQGIINSVRNAL